MMTIKWHWGTKIILVYLGFVAFMLTMVWLCTRQHYDLVAGDYYAQELKYQEVIDGQHNLQLLGKKVTITQQEQALMLTLPATSADVQGTVQVYRPDNARLDFSVPATAQGEVRIPNSQLQPGLYKIKSRWTSQGKAYYDEQSFFAP